MQTLKILDFKCYQNPCADGTASFSNETMYTVLYITCSYFHFWSSFRCLWQKRILFFITTFNNVCLGPQQGFDIIGR